MHLIGFNAMKAMGNVQMQNFAPKTRFMHIIGFNAMKALGKTCNRIKLCSIRLTSTKTILFLRFNAFFSKNDLECANTCYFVLKNACYAHYSFQRNESTGKRANAKFRAKNAFYAHYRF